MDNATLRMTVAVNHFKHLLLGDLHRPGMHQVTEVFNKLEACDKTEGITNKTWKSWFEPPQIIPRIETIRRLDRLAECAVRTASMRDSEATKLPSEFYEQLVHGGLVNSMMKASKSKHPLIALRDRAENYHPISALHLHIDAIEICALAEGYGDIPWETVVQIGAERILKLLTNRWGPRQGTVFSELSSDLRLQWNAASPEERIEIRKGFARFRPNPFESSLNARAIPNWQLAGVEADVSPLHIYKALFSLAADASYLVADRLAAWSLDLATSALAMHALAWTDRYNTFDESISDEMIFWCALDDLFFTQELFNLDKQNFVGAMSRCNAEWSKDSCIKFFLARKLYRTELRDLGITRKDVISIAMQSTSAHPLVYRA